MNWRTLATLTLISALTVGCATMKPGDFCDVARPMRPSLETVKAMSAEQKRGLIAHNEYGEKNCGWKP